MCANSYYAQKPEEALAALMNKELNVNVSPEAVRLFVLLRWSRISVLAHQVHDNG
jgi:hypothetical protein